MHHTPPPVVNPTQGLPIDPPGEDHPVVYLRSSWPPNYNVDTASLEAGLDCSNDPSKTQQQFREDSDINTIVRRFGLTGQLPENASAPAYGDFDEVLTYHDAMNMVRRADEAFMALPADVRYRFSNDPQLLMDFVSDADNLAEAQKLGLTRALSGVPLGDVVAVKPDVKTDLGNSPST